MFMGPMDLSFFDWVVVFAVVWWPLTLLLLLAMTISTFAGLYKVFQKAGENGSHALISIYNLYGLVDIADLKSWFATTIVMQAIGLVSAFILRRAEVLEFKSVTNLDSGGKFIQFYSLPNIAAYCLAISIGVMFVYLFYLVAKRFNKGLGFSLGLAALPFVFWPILGFGNAQYDKLTESKQALRHD